MTVMDRGDGNEMHRNRLLRFHGTEHGAAISPRICLCLTLMARAAIKLFHEVIQLHTARIEVKL